MSEPNQAHLNTDHLNIVRFTVENPFLCVFILTII